MDPTNFYNDIKKLIDILPPKISCNLREKNLDSVVEIILDLGRIPEIRYLDEKIEYLENKIVEQEDIDYLVKKIDAFTSDNRSGIPGTLHRISAIKNRKGNIIGLTCRIGRAITGTIFCIEDLVHTGKSILFLGRPGVGKTTKLREISKLLADDLGKRVIIVDTSNEIAGDGDIPHAAIGKSRRMQVSSPGRQKDVMIEGVENHTPEVIVVDEIGTEKEAQAARTIAERGVMLIATAHGNTLENLIKNPVLSDLVGGVSSVTLGDDEAKRRSTQKTVLEREKKPTFDVVIEIIDRDTLAVYSDVTSAVDSILRGWTIQPEIRKTGSVYTSKPIHSEKPAALEEKINYDFNFDKYIKELKDHKKIYVYAVSRSLIDKSIEKLNLKAEVTRNIDEADLMLSHKSYAKGGAKILNVAKTYELPIYFVKSNTMPQVHKTLKEALNVQDKPGDEIYEACFDETETALEETQYAVKQVLNGDNGVELQPRGSHIRKLQRELVEQHDLKGMSIGQEPNRRIRIVPKPNLRNTG